MFDKNKKRRLGVSKVHNNKEKEIKVKYNMEENVHYLHLLNHVRNYVTFQTTKHDLGIFVVDLLAVVK